MKSTLIMAVIMAFAFMGCQPKIQDLSVKSEKDYGEFRELGHSR